MDLTRVKKAKTIISELKNKKDLFIYDITYFEICNDISVKKKSLLVSEDENHAIYLYRFEEAVLTIQYSKIERLILDIKCSEQDRVKYFLNIYVTNIVKYPNKKGLRGRLFNECPRCALCGRIIEDYNQSNLDHIIPRSKGGSNRRSNIQLTHRKCNTLKGNMMPEEWEEYRDRLVS